MIWDLIPPEANKEVDINEDKYWDKTDVEDDNENSELLKGSPGTRRGRGCLMLPDVKVKHVNCKCHINKYLIRFSGTIKSN